MTLMRLRAEEKGYLCLTLITMPLPACTAQHSDGVDDVAESEALLFMAEFNAISLCVQRMYVVAFDNDKIGDVRNLKIR